MPPEIVDYIAYGMAGILVISALVLLYFVEIK